MHRVVGFGILYFIFASIEGVLRITGVSYFSDFFLLRSVYVQMSTCPSGIKGQIAYLI